MLHSLYELIPQNLEAIKSVPKHETHNNRMEQASKELKGDIINIFDTQFNRSSEHLTTGKASNFITLIEQNRSRNPFLQVSNVRIIS